MNAPYFLVTIDTEGDNLWARPTVATTRNAAFLHRFQELCERFSLKPTYLTTYEMARCRTFRDFGRDVLGSGTAEIGMHLHAWDSPPLLPLTREDSTFQPYLVEFPDAVMRQKIHVMTATLEDTFGVKMVSHRAGRWAFDERYACLLVEFGYRVDCSVTPLLSWRTTQGDPEGAGGTDYRRYPHDAYWVDLSDISRPGDSPLLEVPVTIVPSGATVLRRASQSLDALPPSLAHAARPLRRMYERISPSVRWLRPNGRNRRQLLGVVERVIEERRPYAEFMLHSSELMPGGSPTFRDAERIEMLYADLTALFEATRGRFVGATLAEFHHAVSSKTAAHAAAG